MFNIQIKPEIIPTSGVTVGQKTSVNVLQQISNKGFFSRQIVSWYKKLLLASAVSIATIGISIVKSILGDLRNEVDSDTWISR